MVNTSSTLISSNVPLGSIQRRLQNITLTNISEVFAIDNPISFESENANQFGVSSSSKRFGYTSDFVEISGNNPNQYINGLISLAVLILSLYTVWLTIMLLLCCLGSKRVGFLSGQPFNRVYYYIIPKEEKRKGTYVNERNEQQQKVEISTNNTQVIESQHSLKIVPNTNNPPKGSWIITKSNEFKCCYKTKFENWIRGIYVLCGILVIIFAISCYANGITKVQATITKIQGSAIQVENLSSRGDDLVTDIRTTIEQQINTLGGIVLDNLSNGTFCPAIPILQNNPITQVIQLSIETGLERIRKLMTYNIGPELVDIQRDIQEVNKASANAVTSIESIDAFSSPLLLLLFLFLLIISSILVTKAGVTGWYGKTNNRFNWIVIWIVQPLFVLLLILIMISCATSLSLASANADFCYPTEYDTKYNTVIQTTYDNDIVNPPDVSVLALLQKNGYKSDTLDYKIAKFYILQCSDPLPEQFERIINYLPIVELALEYTPTMTSDLSVTPILETICDSNFTKLTDDISNFMNALSLYQSLLAELIDIIQCSTVVPIYQDTFYTASCQYSMDAFIWLFTSFVIVTTFGFVMLFFRSSILDTQYTYIYDFVEQTVSIEKKGGAVIDNQSNKDSIPTQSKEQPAPNTEDIDPPTSNDDAALILGVEKDFDTNDEQCIMDKRMDDNTTITTDAYDKYLKIDKLDEYSNDKLKSSDSTIKSDVNNAVDSNIVPVQQQQSMGNIVEC